MAAFVQRKTNHLENPASFTVTLTSNTTACNTLLLALAVLDTAEASATITDSQGNTWESILKTYNGAGSTLQTFMASDIVGGACTITVTFPGAVGRYACIVSEESGLPPRSAVNVVDRTSGAYGSSGNPSAGSVTTTQSDEFIWSVAALLGTATLTPGSGNTAGNTSTSGSSLQVSDEYQNSGGAGTYSDGWTGSTGLAWLAQTISFVESVAAGPTLINAFADGSDGSGGWSGFSNPITLSTQAATTSSLTSGHTSDTLKCQFSAGAFSLPTGVTPIGIAISFEAEAPGTSFVVNVSSVKVSLGTADRSDSASVGSTYQTFQYGGACDLWGGTPTYSQVNGAWEIDLKFSCSGGFGSLSVRNVTATVIYYMPL